MSGDFSMITEIKNVDQSSSTCVGISLNKQAAKGYRLHQPHVSGDFSISEAHLNGQRKLASRKWGLFRAA